jgi:hypothetical protein
MYYQFIFYAWVYDSDPIAASQGCGSSMVEYVNAEDVAGAVREMVRTHPFVQLDSMRIVCKPLDLDIRYEPKKT